MRHAPGLLSLVEGLAPGTATFADLSARCLGAWPGSVAAAVRELRGNGRVSAADARRLGWSAGRRSRHGGPWHDARLPLPHPLDHDWRFTCASADALLRMVSAARPKGGKLLLVCSPTIAFRVKLMSVPWQVTLLAREGDPVTSAISRELGSGVEILDLDGDVESIGADAAIVDPPWYDDVAVPLMATAAAGTREGGLLLSCYPDELTGASQAEWIHPRMLSRILSGIVPIEGRPARVRYETPLFEVNALRKLGLPGTHPRWRTGRVLASLREGRVRRATLAAAEGWSELQIADAFGMETAVDPGVMPADNDVVASVSRAHPVRGTARWWTSGNRVGAAGSEGNAYMDTGVDAGRLHPLGTLLANERTEAVARVRWFGSPSALAPGQDRYLLARLPVPRIYVAPPSS